MKRVLWYFPVILFVFAGIADARMWCIRPDGSGDAPTIQAGLDSAAAGDTVLLTGGTYYEHDLLMTTDVILRGEAGDPQHVTIDAQNQGYVILCGGLDPPACMEGLTITGGSLGGMHCLSSRMRVNRCVFAHNSTTDKGGGMYVSSGRPEITACTFWDNYAGWEGGAIMCYQEPGPMLANCTFYGNGAGYRNGGGAMMSWHSSPELHNTIIASGTGGSAIGCVGGSANLSCCNVYGNVGGDWYGCISGLDGIDGNFSECPSFCDAEHGDFGLCDQSPCLPGNHPYGYDCGLIGAHDKDCACGPTQTGTTTWGAVKAMYR